MTKKKGLWIPEKILENETLAIAEKVILSLVHSFHQNGLEFFQSNSTIADKLHISESTVKRSIRSLTLGGFISVESFNGRKRKIELTEQGQNDLAVGSNRPSSKVKLNQQTGQNDPADRSKRPSNNNSTKQPKKNVENKSAKKSPKVKPIFNEWDEIWELWKTYKHKEHRFRFKSEMSESAARAKLHEISNNDINTAKEIIRESIAQGYKGLFPLKRGTTATKGPDANEFAQYIQTGEI